MFLNSVQPSIGSANKPRRVGRGIGSGLGKTSGRGHKGQKSRSGGFHKVGFEGGQMPLQRRLPKRGFKSLLQKQTAELRLASLNSLMVDEVDLLVLKKSGLVSENIVNVKVILHGELSRPMVLKGIRTTKKAEAAILAVGGRIEE